MTGVNPNLLGVLALVIIAATLYFASTPIRTTAGNVSIPTKNNFVSTVPKDAPNGTMHIHTTKAIPAGADMYVDVKHNGLSQTATQAAVLTAAGVDVSYVRNRPLYKLASNFPFDDWGTFAGGRTNGSRSDRFAAGLRISPVRLLYETVAPDILLAPKDVGLGVSFYVPPDLCGSRFDHWGLGVGRLFSTAHGGESTVVYVGFSTYEP